MKYCTKCGAEIMDEAVVCPKCGCATGSGKLRNAVEEETPVIRTVAKIFMILGCIAMAFTLIPLCWTIPMTVSYWNKTRDHRPVTTGFKVCCLLFVSLVAGILMLCDSNPD